MPRTRAPELILAGIAAILLIGTVIGLIVGRDDDEGGSSASAGGNAVDIADFAFVPAELTVSVDDTVTWTNQDSTGHTVTRTDGTESSDELDEGATYELTFDEAGEFTYACSIHPSMEGTVVVEGS
jgi:plastocyanin